MKPGIENPQEGKTYSPEALLEQLRVQNGATEARVYKVSTVSWQAHMSWGEQVPTPGVLRVITSAVTAYAAGDDALQAVDALARMIPRFREEAREQITEGIKRLRALAKTI